MSKRKPRTRPLYRDRYNRDDAATYRPRGTKEQVRRQMESEATYETAADAIADMRRAFDAGCAVLCELLGRVMAVEAEHGRLGEGLAQLDAVVEAEKGTREALEEARKTDGEMNLLRARAMKTLCGQMGVLEERVKALEAVVLINSHPPGTFAPQKATTPETVTDCEIRPGTGESGPGGRNAYVGDPAPGTRATLADDVLAIGGKRRPRK